MQKLIEELTELEANATPGPWTTNSIIGPICTTDGYHIANTHSCISGHDATFIVAMRNALPELLNRYEWWRLRYEAANKTTNEMREERDAALARAEKAELATVNAKFDRDIVYAQLAYFNAHGDFEDLITEKNAALSRADKAEKVVKELAEELHQTRIKRGEEALDRIDIEEELEQVKAERGTLAKICSGLKIDDGDNPTERWCPKEMSGTCMRCYIVDPGEDEWCEQGLDDIDCWLKWVAREATKHKKEK